MKKYLPYALSLIIVLAGTYLILYPGINPFTIIKSKLSPNPAAEPEAEPMQAVTDLSKLNIK